MIETFATLLFAHVLADFALQPRWMALQKRNPGVLLAHGAVVLAAAQLATGGWMRWELIALAAAHVAIDATKTWGRFTGPGA